MIDEACVAQNINNGRNVWNSVYQVVMTPRLSLGLTPQSWLRLSLDALSAVLKKIRFQTCGP